MLAESGRLAESLTQKQLPRESSDGDLDGGEKDESVKRHCEVSPVLWPNHARFSRRPSGAAKGQNLSCHRCANDFDAQHAQQWDLRDRRVGGEACVGRFAPQISVWNDSDGVPLALALANWFRGSHLST